MLNFFPAAPQQIYGKITIIPRTFVPTGFMVVSTKTKITKNSTIYSTIQHSTGKY